MNIGLFGGTFDPIHKGHTALAEYIRKELKLDEVWFLVTPQNPWKKDKSLSPDSMRLEMARIALRPFPCLKASDYEFHLEKPSYTYQTLRSLRSDYPQHCFTLIIGADNWAGFDKWSHPEEILTHHPIAVFPREGYPLPASSSPDVHLINAPLINVSSTEIRNRTNHNQDISDLIDKDVEQYIINNGLYHSNNMKTPSEILELVNNYIENLPYERKPFSLYEPMQYVLSLGGKRIRPTLMLLAYNMYKDNPEVILPTACGLETYHNHTLLHDDLMDQADMRRGKETVHKRWDDNTAVLSGDAMLIMAYRLMEGCPDANLRQIMNLFTETALEICEGQQWDMEFETRDDVAEEEYIEMIRLKTSVLLACAIKMGAILAGASAEDQQLLYNFGVQMGLAFQLQDDYLDVYGDPKVFGKNIGGDITSNKKTYMLINALRLADGEVKAELEQWIAAKDFNKNEKIAAVTAIYNRLGIDKMAKEKIEFYFAESRKSLDAISLPAVKKEQLIAFTNAMMKRNK